MIPYLWQGRKDPAAEVEAPEETAEASYKIIQLNGFAGVVLLARKFSVKTRVKPRLTWRHSSWDSNASGCSSYASGRLGRRLAQAMRCKRRAAPDASQTPKVWLPSHWQRSIGSWEPWCGLDLDDLRRILFSLWVCARRPAPCLRWSAWPIRPLHQPLHLMLCRWAMVYELAYLPAMEILRPWLGMRSAWGCLRRGSARWMRQRRRNKALWGWLKLFDGLSGGALQVVRVFTWSEAQPMGPRTHRDDGSRTWIEDFVPLPYEPASALRSSPSRWELGWIGHCPCGRPAMDWRRIREEDGRHSGQVQLWQGLCQQVHLLRPWGAEGWERSAHHMPEFDGSSEDDPWFIWRLRRRSSQRCPWVRSCVVDCAAWSEAWHGLQEFAGQTFLMQCASSSLPCTLPTSTTWSMPTRLWSWPGAIPTRASPIRAMSWSSRTRWSSPCKMPRMQLTSTWAEVVWS